jgi:ABC-type glycerol-3-phosphate transport system substrate-binding protein
MHETLILKYSKIVHNKFIQGGSKMNKKFLALGLGAAMMMGMAIGASAEEEKTVINFYEHSDSEKIATQLVEAYNASQDDVEVKLSIIANDDYDDKIKVMLSGGADIDCFWIRGGDQLRQLANGGAVLALDDMMDAAGVDFSVYGQMGEAYQTGGHTYGLCTSKSCWLLWYNKDLFDAAGIDYPLDLTWDEYADLCAQLNTDGLNGGLCVNWIMNTGAAAVGEYLTDEDLTRTKEYVEFLNRIYNEDESNLSLEEMSGSFDVNAVFAEGETYMMLNGDWNFLLFPDSDPDFEWCAAPLPHFEDAEVNTTVGSTSAFCISSASDKAQAAFDFIKFCCYSDEGAKIYAQNANVPAYPSDEALEVYKESVTTPGTEYVFASLVNSEDGNEDYYNELKEAYKAEITEYLIGNCTIDEAFDNYKARREEIENK